MAMIWSIPAATIAIFVFFTSSGIFEISTPVVPICVQPQTKTFPSLESPTLNGPYEDICFILFFSPEGTLIIDIVG